MTKPKILCWDLDENLGVFTNIVYHLDTVEFINMYRQEYAGFGEEFDMSELKAPPRIVQVRAGLEELLRRTNVLGFRNILTTGSRQDYAEECLRATKLRKYFDAVFSFPDNPVKDYASVASWAGLSTSEDMATRMAVLSHDLIDKPTSCQGILFLYDPSAIKHSADYLNDLFLSLLKENPDSLSEGFRSIAKSSPLTLGRTILNLSYRQFVPTIEVVSSPLVAMKEVSF